MSRKKIVIELTEFEAETLRKILGNIYVDQLMPDMSPSQAQAAGRISRRLTGIRRV
jgi:hypothetical protein